VILRAGTGRAVVTDFGVSRLGRREVVAAADGEQALVQYERTNPALVVLDLMLPKLDGFEVCRELRRRGDVPILMLTARSEDVDAIVGLELGADDYVTKPFSLAELIARIRNLLRRKAMRTPAQIEVVEWDGRIRVDFKQFRCWVDGMSVELSTREFEILRDFANHPGEVVRREDLLERVWGYSPDNLPSTRTVDNFLMRLRQKLEADPAVEEVLRNRRDDAITTVAATIRRKADGWRGGA